MSDVLILEKHRELFKDDESVREFARLLQDATQGRAMQLLLFGERLVGAIISTSEAQDRLRERIAARLIQEPGSLEALQERLRSEDLVEPAAPTPGSAKAPRPSRAKRAPQKAGKE